MCYISVRLVHPIFERLVPSKSNHGGNNQEFNQQSLHVRDCQKERSIQSAAQVGECLYRNRHGVYFAWFSIRGKQVKRSLKTSDKELGRRRLGELRKSLLDF